MVNLYKQDGEILYGVKEYIIDSIDDVKDLHTNVRPGSIAMLVPSGLKYILNGKKEWVLLMQSSGGGSEGGNSEILEELLRQYDANYNGTVDEVEMTIF